MRKSNLLVAAVLLVVPIGALYWDTMTGRAQVPPAAAAAPVVTSPYSSTKVASTDPVPTPVLAANARVPAPPVWSKAPALEAAVDKAMKGFPGRYSVVVHELASGEQWTLNERDRYHPASTIKMPVALYALEQYRTGKLGWQDMIEYTKADFESPGGGLFETSPFGGLYPVENLVNRAIKYSNNVAVNMLGRHLGWENIRAWTRSIDGELFREPDANPSVTAMSELGWWIHLETLSRTDAKHAALVLQPLREVAYDGRIAAGLPEDVAFVHKFGSYNGYYHDTGWIKGENPFLLIVLTHGAQVDEADAAIARVTAEIFKVMEP